MQSKYHKFLLWTINTFDEISFITNNKDIIIKKNEVDEQFLRQANGVYPDAPQFVKCFKTESFT